MSESHHQRALIEWWDNVGCKKHGMTPQRLFAIPNGGARSAATGANLKREGVRKGVFDLRLEAARNGKTGLYIEMKYGKNKLTPEQESFAVSAMAAGARCVTCWNWEDAKIEIEEYLA